MKQKIIWPEKMYGNDGPFAPSSREPLKITLHNQSFGELDKNQSEALKAILELSNLIEIETFAFDLPALQKIQIEDAVKGNYHNVRVTDVDGQVISFNMGINATRVTPERVKRTLGRYSLQGEELQACIDDLKCGEAHHALRRHLFVTGSEFLLGNRDQLNYINARTPLETIKIISLFLRSKGNWIIAAEQKSTFSIGKREFFSSLFKGKVTNYIEYAVAFKKAEHIHGEQLLENLFGFAEKCIRALEARDEVVALSYQMQDFPVGESTSYHFDYMLILLAGAYDSLAEIYRIVYGPTWVNFSNFRAKGFRRMLRRANATGLSKHISSRKSKMLEEMLHNLRNQIHGLLPSSSLYQMTEGHTETCIELPHEFRDKVWAAAGTLSTQNSWGLTRRDFSVVNAKGQETKNYRINLDPHTYAIALTDEWLNNFNEIVACIEMKDIFRGENVPKLEIPKEKMLFEVNDRVMTLAI